CENNELPLHSELPVELTWDLTPLYKKHDAWEKDFKAIDPLVGKFMSFKGRLAESPEALAGAIAAMDDMERLAEKVYTYAHLKADEDTGNSGNSALVDRISSKFAKISGETAWFDPEFMSIPLEIIGKFMKSKILKFYKRSLDELLRERPHTLSEKEERILGLSSDVMNNAHKTFSKLNNADMKFPKVKNDQGKRVMLTHGNYIDFLESHDREVRHGAFNAMFNTYEKYRNTLASTLDGTVKKHVFNANIRNYPSALDASLFEDNIPAEVYNNLITAVKSKLPALHKYLSVRSKALKLKKLDMYDIYNPLVPECRVKVSWEQACKWVMEALKPLGEEYCEFLKNAFSQRWIDVMECKGKRSGAYSSGCYDSFPYVLLNFNGTLNDVFTLAHELGHSMHSFYSNRSQQYHYADYSIFVAEVASTTNELLLHHYLMKQKREKNVQAYLLCHMADEIRGTIYRQTMFAEFEKLIHEKAENSIPLTPDLLSEEYYKLNTEYYGKTVEADKRIEMEWARIPHFYYNFYVYKYATGMSAAVKLSNNILSGSKEKLDAYLGFLKAGDSKDVLDIMKDAGVDLSSPAPIQEALEEFDNIVEQLKRKMQ
ncbi:MAG: oligoendopeptidase F, partial [Victivallaceae bacterium]